MKKLITGVSLNSLTSSLPAAGEYPNLVLLSNRNHLQACFLNSSSISSFEAKPILLLPTAGREAPSPAGTLSHSILEAFHDQTVTIVLPKPGNRFTQGRRITEKAK